LPRRPQKKGEGRGSSQGKGGRHQTDNDRPKRKPISEFAMPRKMVILLPGIMVRPGGKEGGRKSTVRKKTLNHVAQMVRISAVITWEMGKAIEQKVVKLSHSLLSCEKKRRPKRQTGPPESKATPSGCGTDNKNIVKTADHERVGGSWTLRQGSHYN